MATILAYTDPNSGLFSLVDFDIVTGEEHSISATVSTHAVESGAAITDHVRPSLDKLSLRVRVTDSPLNRVTAGTSPGPLLGSYGPMQIVGSTSRQDSYANVKGGYAPLTIPSGIPLIGGISAPTLGFKRPFVAPEAIPGERSRQFVTLQAQVLKLPPIQRVRRIFEVLASLCKSGTPVEVTSDVRYYPRLLITSLSAPRDGTNGIEFAMELQELRTAKTQKVFVEAKAQPKPAEKRAEAEKPQGAQAEPWKLQDKASLFIQGQQFITRGFSLSGG